MVKKMLETEKKINKMKKREYVVNKARLSVNDKMVPILEIPFSCFSPGVKVGDIIFLSKNPIARLSADTLPNTTNGKVFLVDSVVKNKITIIV